MNEQARMFGCVQKIQLLSVLYHKLKILQCYCNRHLYIEFKKRIVK
jgi:hypothetical protein